MARNHAVHGMPYPVFVHEIPVATKRSRILMAVFLQTAATAAGAAVIGARRLLLRVGI